MKYYYSLKKIMLVEKKEMPTNVVQNGSSVVDERRKRRDFFWSFMATCFVSILITVLGETEFANDSNVQMAIMMIGVTIFIISILKRRYMIPVGMFAGLIAGFAFFFGYCLLSVSA
jgi:hypothetical protein